MALRRAPRRACTAHARRGIVSREPAAATAARPARLPPTRGTAITPWPPLPPSPPSRRDFFQFDAGDAATARARGISPETAAAIQKWLADNADDKMPGLKARD
jgi:hypothetical protein